jgi:hypothetical protein
MRARSHLTSTRQEIQKVEWVELATIFDKKNKNKFQNVMPAVEVVAKLSSLLVFLISNIFCLYIFDNIFQVYFNFCACTQTCEYFCLISRAEAASVDRENSHRGSELPYDSEPAVDIVDCRVPVTLFLP